MKILGIETSCDETAVCLIEADGAFDAGFQCKVLGNALHSQIAVHAPYGGVFPNLAKREHVKNLVPLLQQVFEQSSTPRGSTAGVGVSPRGLTSWDPFVLKQILEREPELFGQLDVFLKTHGKPGIDAIAVTHGPGLEPALWVGVNFAKALSLAWDIPIVPVNHLEGHIAMAAIKIEKSYSSVLQNTRIRGRLQVLEFPLIALLISGGHTELDLVKDWPHFETIGETRDDAVGEAFDKVARMIGLPYPGGPHVSALAARARTNAERTQNDAERIPRESASGPHSSALSLPRPMIHEDNFDFSFSGLKTAVLRLVKDKTLTEVEKMGLSREFEDAAADVLVAKTVRAVEEYGAQTVLVGGGVSANTHIKSELKVALDEIGIALLYPPHGFETDNALMIALAGYFRALNKEFVDPDTLRANGNLRLGTTGANA
ncbi:MAG TPA: tRNA (adenosine(37)-N6)-threonylcarbamoyltransferase complex transferase subunit TsaD [Candidatus Paceibacterota bacterium]